MMLPSTASGSQSRLSAFTQLAAALAGSLNLDDMLRRVLDFGTTLVYHPVPIGCLALFDAGSATWRFAAWKLPPDPADLPLLPITGGIPDQPGLLQILRDSANLIEIADCDGDARVDGEYRSVLPPSLTAVPLVVDGNVIGGIFLAGLPLGQEERDLLRALGALAAGAIRNAQVLEQAHRRTQESTRLAERASALRAIGCALIEEQDLNRVARLVAENGQQLLATERAQLSLLDENGRTYTIVIAVGSGEDRYCGMRIPVKAQTLTGCAIRTRQLVVSQDARNDPRAYQSRVAASDTRNVMSAPLIARGRLVGALNVSNKIGGKFTDDDIALIEEFAQMAALAVDNARQFANASRMANEQRAMRKLVTDISGETAQALRGGSALDLESLLRLVVNYVHDLAQADGVGIAVPDNDGELRWLVIAGDCEAVEGAPVAADSLAFKAIRQHRPASTTSQAWTMPEVRAPAPLLPEGLRAAVAAPLSVAGAEPLGALFLGWREDRAIPTGSSLLTERAAGVAATALLNNRLVQQARDLGALRERSRLARDLHDSVTQSLFSINAFAQVAPTLWDSAPEEARGSLEQIQQLSREALAEMRALLQQLHPVAQRGEDLPAALRRLTDGLSRHAGPPVRFSVCGAARPDPRVEEALYRIAQEAINNARRHSGAEAVEVRLDLQEQRAVLVVRDRGRGFAPNAEGSRPGHFGMLTMRERAAEIGGHFTLASVPGRGTLVRVTAPRYAPLKTSRP